MYIPWGYSNYFFDRVKPLPMGISKDFSLKKQLILLFSFLFIFSKCLQIGTHFYRLFNIKNSWFFKFSQFLWIGILFKGFFWPKWNLCLRIFGEKVTHWVAHIPKSFNKRIPPPLGTSICIHKYLKHIPHLFIHISVSLPVWWCMIGDKWRDYESAFWWYKIRPFTSMQSDNLYLINFQSKFFTESLSIVIIGPLCFPI